jgi:uncharacterized protein
MLPLPTHDQVNLLVVAGLRSWANDPWQDWLDLRFRDARWIRPVDGEWPDLGVWANRIERVLEERAGESWLVVAHGFGALAVAWHAMQSATDPAGIILFAPADPQRFAITAQSFGRRLPCPATVVASTAEVPDNHPWLNGAQAREWSKHWGARFVDAGAGPGPREIPGWALGQRVLEHHVSQLGEPALRVAG